MDNHDKATGQDASHIKPVSSLRSHFESMSKAKEGNPAPQTTPLRPISPAPKPVAMREIKPEKESAPTPPPLPKNRPTLNSLKLPSTTEDARSRSPTRLAAPPPPLSPKPLKPMRPPSVLIQPPLSPPKERTTHLNLGEHTAFLNPDSITASTTPASSPRTFKIPSRTHSPAPDPRRLSRTTGSTPPSPPPPRRSGELKREIKPVPPPVNRAEKPSILARHSVIAPRPQNGTIHTPQVTQENSPFSSPPSSAESSEDEAPPPVPRRPRPQSEYSQPRSQGWNTFELPPAHPSVARRPEREVQQSPRPNISPQYTGERRPALPTRPQPSVEAPPRPPSINTSTKPPPPRPPRPTVNTNSNFVESSSAPPVPPSATKIMSPSVHRLPPPPTRTNTRSLPPQHTGDRQPGDLKVLTNALAQPPASAPRAEPPGQALSYPDASNVNRRPPFIKQGAHEIATKYDARVIDVCGQYVCSVGQLTRAWNLQDGEQVMSLAHGEGTKATAAIFKPAAHVDEEGARLWVGNNMGELMEVDVMTQSVVSIKPNAHGRCEIVKMYRHFTEIWTLDDAGALHVWGPTENGVPSLSSSPSQIYRVPKGHTFSMVVGDQLWHVTGKEIRVFAPSLSGKGQFQVLIRALVQEIAGDVTAGTVMKSDPDKVLFGHADGRVSVYSRSDYSCLKVMNVSSYKINSMACVGAYIWAGYNNGRICVYDTATTPWAVKKEWHAHDNPVIKLIADPASAYHIDRSQVVSFGADNMIRAWDGLLQEDWLEEQMKSLDAKYCQFEDLKVMLMTWNAGASTPHSLRYSDTDSTFIQNLLQHADRPDILIFGFQELVDLEDKTATAKRFFKPKKKDKKEGSVQERMSHQYRDWRDFLLKSLDDYTGELYHLLQTAHMVGLFTCIFVKSTVRDRIRNLKNVEVKRGMGGLHGNKGAVIIRFMVDDTSLCFVNCHLAAGQSQANARHTDVAAILDSALLPSERDPIVRMDSFVGGGDGTMILDHELCLLSGDLNYRIDTMSRDTVVSAVKSNNLAKLLERDQLLVARRRNPAFRLRAFDEMPITFAPTYKYDVGTDTYDTSEKKRSPAWCDRVLHRGGGRIKQIDYLRHEVRVSDHRPVTARLKYTVKSVDQVKRAEVWANCLHRFEDVRQSAYDEEKLFYLSWVIGYDEATSRKLIKEKMQRKLRRSSSRHREL
ncbi:hypothetical protein jhhlp_008675 [Lomentospora prolificans]|uniref:Inositol polyphosphate-related phosphatase domain-containing protein n=1 Tax=Lomentospora prolificans TaxID=41688 RepID=A0A2N3MYQ2_9PEZI|nr:hypothetical protein jhhlp_008675 [Lomentospora prolificans]